MLNLNTLKAAKTALDRTHLVLVVSPGRGIHYKLKSSIRDNAHLMLDYGDCTPSKLFSLLARNAKRELIIIDTGLLYRDRRGAYREEFADLLTQAMGGNISMKFGDTVETYQIEASIVVTCYSVEKLPARLLQHAILADGMDEIDSFED